MKTAFHISVITLAAGLSLTLIADARADAQQNLDNAKGFMKMMYNDHKASDAFLTYMSEDFVDHVSVGRGKTRDQIAAFFANMKGEAQTNNVIRGGAMDDMVFLERDNGDVDLYRFNDKAKIIEHWEVTPGKYPRPSAERPTSSPVSPPKF